MLTQFIQFYLERIPTKSDDDRRVQWIQQITKHQPFDANRTFFNVCIRHFNNSDFDLNKKNRVLKKGAIPTVFEEIEQAEYENATDNNHIEHCEKCPYLKIQIQDLNKEIIDFTAKHNIEVEKLKQKIRHFVDSEAKKNCLLNEARKEISKEKTQTKKLKDAIAELGTKRFITPDDEALLNVIP